MTCIKPIRNCVRSLLRNLLVSIRTGLSEKSATWDESEALALLRKRLVDNFAF